MDTPLGKTAVDPGEFHSSVISPTSLSSYQLSLAWSYLSASLLMVPLVYPVSTAVSFSIHFVWTIQEIVYI